MLFQHFAARAYALPAYCSTISLVNFGMKLIAFYSVYFQIIPNLFSTHGLL